MSRIALLASGLLAGAASLQAAGPAYGPAHAACMARAGGVTAAMVDCIGAELARQERRLDAAYRRARAALPASRRAALTRAQRAWIAFKEAECAFVLDPDGGSLARVAANACVLRMTAARAGELEALAIEAAAR